MLYTILRSLIAGFQSRQSLVLENLALRHQVQVLKRGDKRPKIKKRDRALWVILSRFWLSLLFIPSALATLTYSRERNPGHVYP
jgi:hypothetical protein